MNSRPLLLAAFILVFAANPSQSQFQLENAFTNLTFTRPVDLQHAGDGTNRIFVVEQPGVIRVFENNRSVASARTFLDIRDRVNASGDEEGLLGLAFHPNYETNGHFFVNYTANPPRRTVIARYRVSATDPNQAVADSELVILTFDQPFSNHNGGQLAFGPDGFLYIATGDGGSGGDPQNNGQSLQTLLGKILRIDVNTATGGRRYGIPSDNPFAGNTVGNREEIFAYGLRNPWRMSFDPVTQWLWAGDVGQNRFEEIDIIEKGKNYGWRIMEGNACFNPPSGCNMTGLVKPIWSYDRNRGDRSVTGGYVYRGANVPALAGAYIYGDFISSRIWALRYDGINPPQNTELLDTNIGVASFGVDQNNELYICAFDSRIYRFKPTTTSGGDNPNLPISNQLAQNYPNPLLNESPYQFTTIRYLLRQDAAVEVNLYNLQGQLVRTLVRQTQSVGPHNVTWDGRDDNGNLLSSGTYLYRLKIGDAVVETKRLVWVR